MQLKNSCPNNDNLSVFIDDDDKVAYAYLLDDDVIISDVWLYNVRETPEKPEWFDKNNMPFLNAKEYIKEPMVSRIEKGDDIHVQWKTDKNGEVENVELSIKGIKTCILAPNRKLGWSYFVKKDGPLAKIANAE